jgi:putative DNA primase/helicase
VCSSDLAYQLGLEEDMAEAQRSLRAATEAVKQATAKDADTPPEVLATLTAEQAKAGGRLAAVRGEWKKAKTRVDKLRKTGGAAACLDWAHKIGDQSLAILGDAIDLHPWLLPCPNGVLDLRTAKFSPGRPRDYMLRAIAVPWEGIDTPSPTWDHFFSEIHQGDREIIDYLDRLFGYSLTGLTTHHFIGFFLGDGRNGKGTMFELLRYLMGDLGWSITPELILEQKNARSSAGPSPDLMSLHGRRMVIASESDEHRRVSLQQVKRLTGGDTINARAPHDRAETNITPSWKLFFYTNHVPTNIARDFALQQRLVYLKYPLKFVADPDPSDPLQRRMDPDLPEKLRAEAPGILARLVRGCLSWQELGGLHPPAKIRGDIDKLALDQDSFRRFYNDLLSEDAEGEIVFKELYERFAGWYSDEIGGRDDYRPTKKAVSAWLERQGHPRRKPGGVTVVYGLRLATAEELSRRFA